MKNKQKSVNNPTVAELRRKGFKLRISHYRHAFNKQTLTDIPLIVTQGTAQKNPNWHICNFGGHTVMEMTNPDGVSVEILSVCSIEDNFSRRLGVDICIARGLKQLEMVA